MTNKPESPVIVPFILSFGEAIVVSGEDESSLSSAVRFSTLITKVRHETTDDN